MSARRRREIGRSSFQYFALTMLDVFWFMRATRRRVARYVRVDDSFLPMFESPPLIGCTGHIGNWEIMSTLCGLHGAPVTAVAMPLKNAFADRLLKRLRRTAGSVSVPRKGAVRSLIRSLKEGRSIALVIDQNTLTSEGGAFLPFLDLPAPTTKSAGLLWQRTRIPLFVGFCSADRHGVYTAWGSGVFPPPDAELTPEEVTLMAVKHLEAAIRTYPEQWLWSYKRWRYYREGDPAERYPFYAKPYRKGAR